MQHIWMDQRIWVGVIAVSAMLVTAIAFAAENPEEWHKGLPKQYNSEYLVHDLNRPKPKTVTPGETAADPPSDAIVLFKGGDLSAFVNKKDGGPAQRILKDDYMEIRKSKKNHQTDMLTKQKFGDCQLHLEFATPAEVDEGGSQRSGNSGVFFMDRYEIQILDNYENETYADGYVGSVYGQHPPLVNPSRKPGEWQTLDIIFTRPRFDEKGEVISPAYVTVLLNGVLVQNHQEIYGTTGWRKLATYEKHEDRLPIRLQDHANPVRMRNIWIRDLEKTQE